MDAIDLLLNRASNGKLTEPEPDQRSLQIAFEAALRAPDHGALRPWEFILIRAEGRERLGAVLRDSLARRAPETPEADLVRESRKPLRAPLIIVVCARLQEHAKVPSVEQLLSAGAAAQNILLALYATGYNGMWRTGPAAYDPLVRDALGLGPQHAIIGFMYAGTPAITRPAMARPLAAQHVRSWP